MKLPLHTALLFALLFPGLPQVAMADMITTESALVSLQRGAAVERINSFMMREDVKSAMVQFGVDPADAIRRVDALTPSELSDLENRLNTLPAGGTSVVAIVGVVAIVLFILELLGVTDVFTAI